MDHPAEEEALTSIQDEELGAVISAAALVVRAEDQLESHVAALLEAPLDVERGQRLTAYLESEQMGAARCAARGIAGEGR